MDSYYRLFKKIYDEQLDDIIIAEDDCLIKPLEFTSFFLNNPTDICYLNGDMRHAPPSWKAQHEFSRKVGVNEIDYKTSRVIGTLGIYIPHFKLLEPILDYIENTHYQLRAVDIILSKQQLIKKYYYPSVMLHRDNGTSSISGKRYKPLVLNNYMKIK